LQVIDYAFIISALKRAQNINHNVFTASGASFIIEKDLFRELGGFNDESLTEDIELSHRSHILAKCPVLYVDNAIFYTDVPLTFNQLIKQRLRWATGGMQVMLHERLSYEGFIWYWYSILYSLSFPLYLIYWCWCVFNNSFNWLMVNMAIIAVAGIIGLIETFMITRENKAKDFIATIFYFVFWFFFNVSITVTSTLVYTFSKKSNSW